MIEYHLLNCPPFSVALADVFRKFKEKKDKMGMGMVGRIIKAIFSNIDYRMVQALFRDPVFELILEVHQCTKFNYIVLKDIDFPKLWSDKLRIRSIVTMTEEVTIKIHIIHRISFFRENILDLTKESYLEQLLVMTQN